MKIILIKALSLDVMLSLCEWDFYIVLCVTLILPPSVRTPEKAFEVSIDWETCLQTD